ncbi:MAG: trehalase family glycosidase [Candidatus Aminicenantes bacterium]|nr:trehalase family glycosidase [Candidatus Aminicenantes bacterium]
MNHAKFFLFILYLFPCFISAEIQYGAFDPAYWNGLVILKDHHAFAFRQENDIIIGKSSGLTFRFIPIGSVIEKVETKEKEFSGMVSPKVRAFYFYAGFDNPTLTDRRIEEMLETNRINYSALRPQVSGQWQGLIASINNNLAWMKLYQPDKKRIYLPAGRRWIFPKPDGTQDLWTIFEWDAFFNALEAAVEDKELARQEIEAVLDAEMMMRIAGLLGKKEDAETFKKEYETVKEKINQHLWNRDFYYDRYWDGVFSTHKAASNFYPLIAGVPEEERVKKLLEHLSSGKEFWGDYVLPTISRDNPAFKDQQYWRGTIWPPTNYLVYQGLKRYGLDEIAAEFAVKSATLFLNSWQTFGLCRENYNSVTGEGGGQRYQSWGPLFALILLEDFIDISPFDGFRVGNLAASQWGCEGFD